MRVHFVVDGLELHHRGARFPDAALELAEKGGAESPALTSGGDHDLHEVVGDEVVVLRKVPHRKASAI